jgi:hypothetical protein
LHHLRHEATSAKPLILLAFFRQIAPAKPADPASPIPFGDSRNPGKPSHPYGMKIAVDSDAGSPHSGATSPTEMVRHQADTAKRYVL